MRYFLGQQPWGAVERLAVLCGVALLGGCAAPSERYDQHMAMQGLSKMVVLDLPIPLAIYRPSVGSTLDGDGSPLHVYLESDGTPWIRKRLAASDPTPLPSVVIELMRAAPNAGVLVGRPCYHGIRAFLQCPEERWTTGRYADAIVASMATAIDRLAENRGSVILIGYSGGGTLAMLLAERVRKTAAVVTIAANLDTDRWARLHDDHLEASLNPAAREPLPAHIRQLHLAGGRDYIVPPDLLRIALAHQTGAHLEVFEDFDHRCCWAQIWPEVVTRLKIEAATMSRH